MKESMRAFTGSVFGILVFVSVGIGAVAFIMFALALVIGGETGTAWSLTAKKIIDYSIQVASVGVLFGLINIYLGKEHYLTLTNKKPDAAGDINKP